MNDELLTRLREECFIRNFSPRTIFLYEFHINKFLEWTGDPSGDSSDTLTLYDARDYILERRKDGMSSGYCNSINSSLSFLFRHILYKPWNYDIVPRMKLDWKLPSVLSREQIEKLIDTADNIRNKAIISLIYSSGLRVGEVVRLAPGDIHSDTMQVHIRNSKNRGDHWTVLSPRTLDLLRQYWISCPDERDILFVSLRKPHRPLNTGGVEIMLRKIGEEAEIDVHPHILRHSFATHLIENDINREYVQTMLGHKSPSSTSVYIHVSNKSIMGVKSPLDLPMQKKTEEDTSSRQKEGE